MQTLEHYVPPGRALPCVEAGPDLYFSESPRELERAKLLCRPCQLRAACLAGAKERREPWGVWGGEVFVDGRPVPFKRPRGRPRKHPLPLHPDAEEAEAC
jgi:WhiB family redox-sensing transcriptional regulator